MRFASISRHSGQSYGRLKLLVNLVWVATRRCEKIDRNFFLPTLGLSSSSYSRDILYYRYTLVFSFLSLIYLSIISNPNY
jgi:hypothetical protein